MIPIEISPSPVLRLLSSRSQNRRIRVRIRERLEISRSKCLTSLNVSSELRRYRRRSPIEMSLWRCGLSRHVTRGVDSVLGGSSAYSSESSGGARASRNSQWKFTGRLRIGYHHDNHDDDQYHGSCHGDSKFVRVGCFADINAVGTWRLNGSIIRAF